MLDLILKHDATGEALYAARNFRQGEVVLEFEAVVWRAMRDKHTVEHPFGGHVFHPLLAMVSHGCEPNCAVAFFPRRVLAARAIDAGEAIRVDYAATERRISRPFACLCGSDRCRGQIGRLEAASTPHA